MDVKQVLEDFKKARDHKKDWIEEAIEDYQFTVGEQWDDDDRDFLRSVGVHALTINKIQPNIFLISGIQRQNRTDFKAFPEGDEDSVISEIGTKLLKSAIKRCMGDYKMSEIFEDGVICGEGWLEPFIDYTYDLVNGDLKLKKVNPLNIYPDPTFTEYDLSDAEYICKLSPKLTKRQMLRLFPDQEKDLDKIGQRTLDNFDSILESTIQTTGYGDSAMITTNNESLDDLTEPLYDLLEYYYKKYVTKYLVADKQLGTLKEATDKAEAENYVSQSNKQSPDGAAVAVVIKRVMPEIWVKTLVGNKEFNDSICNFYPRWKSFPFIPFFAHKITTQIKEKESMTQGIVRSLKDPQRELNKRRTQELRLLNSSANSGWISEQGAWVKKSDVKKFGSTAGSILEYKKGFQKPEKITPTPLSQGHAQLAVENSQDMKEISGINTDLLAMNDAKSQSGRAIYLRQQQGIVMIQRVLDNFSFTKKILGRFILSQLGELYSVETATKVVGDSFIKTNFSRPVLQQQMNPMTGQPEQVPQTDEQGQLVMQIDNDGVGAVFNTILNDSEVGKYDIAVGEGANSETVKFTNYMLLMDLMEKGIPIPPDVLIEESMLSSESKKKISQAVAQAQQAAQMAQARMSGPQQSAPAEK